MKTSLPPAATASPTPETTTESTPETTTEPTRSPRSGVAARRRRLAAAGIALSVAALAACSSETPVTADPSASAGATTPATTGSDGTSSTTSSTTSTVPSTTAATTPARTDKTVKVELKDDVLGHDITVTRLSRNIPWPAGNPVASESFEIVGVQLTVDAGDRYSADVQPAMFSLKAVSPATVAKPTTEFGAKFGAPLATAKRAEQKTGWLFFKIDRGATGALTLTFNRPAYEVSTTDKAIAAAAISKPIG